MSDTETDTEALERRIERLEEEVGVEPQEDSLPSFRGHQMKHRVGCEAYQGEIYVDGDGDVWLDTENDHSNLCLGMFADEFIDAIEEAKEVSAHE